MSSKPKKPTTSHDHDIVYKPAKEFSAKARIPSMAAYRKLYKQSISKPGEFWAKEAKELVWRKKWTKALEWKAPFAKWFVGGKLNVCENCVDRHAEGARRNKVAILWEGEPGDKRAITYGQLQRDVCKFANVLESKGVKSGDRVLIYMPMVPEAAVAMLACARIGAVHNVVFGGFAADAIVDRLEDSGATTVITADGGWRRGKVVALKPVVDEALEKYKGVKKVIVLHRCGNDVSMKAKRDSWWHEDVSGVSAKHEAKGFDSEHPLFLLYTSGSTGKPKGILHTSGGYLTGTYSTTKYIFDMREEDVYWCTADVGWITGHSYIVYGPLANGATQVMYEGAPNFPDFGRFWKLIEDYGVTIFYTAPTAIRAFMKAGRELPDRHDLSSLRLLGTVGEPINPEAWMWFHTAVGGEKCPIVDTWWQTETGGHMITPLPGATPTKPGTATLPFFGVDAAIVDRNGEEVPANQGGLLVIRRPWPGMLRGILGDRDRFIRTYWSEIEGVYFTGDGARRDEDGYFWIMGRIDDVLNVSGHRLGTAEIESALVAHEAVAEAAVVGVPHEVKGQGVAAFVTLKGGFKPTDELKASLIAKVASDIGALAKPDQIRFTEALPKTRSGKIMRRILKEVAAGTEVKGDITTLEDFAVVERLRAE
ncbi:MAG: acetate--CoA ligase [Phycisphaerae bacterium]